MLVPPEGPPDAPLVIVGRDPGFWETQRGRPFVGPAGTVLDAALADAGVARRDVLVTNVVGVRPAADEWSRHALPDVLAGVEALHATLVGRPRVVVACGAQAFLACATGQVPPLTEGACAAALREHYGGSITEIRGYVWDGAFGPTVATVHPAFITRTWLPWRATLSWDVAKARRWVAGGWPDVAAERAAAARSEAWAPSAVAADALAEEVRGAPVLAVDIETDAQVRPVCVAVAASAARGLCFLLPRDAAVVAELLASPARKVFQNGQFDTTVLARHGLPVAHVTDDIMVQWHAREPIIAGKTESGAKQSQKSLRFLASVFTNEPFWKNYAFQAEEERWRLCAVDARTTFEIWTALGGTAC